MRPPSLRHKQGWPLGGLMIFIMGPWDINPSGDRDRLASPFRLLFNGVPDQGGSHCPRVAFCICLMPFGLFTQFTQGQLETPGSRDSRCLTGARGSDDPQLLACPSPFQCYTETQGEVAAQWGISPEEKKSLPWPQGLEQQGG